MLFDVGVWGLGLVFLLRAVGNLRTFGFFKIVKGTPFADWDTWLYSPLCLLLALLAAGLARLPRGSVSELKGSEKHRLSANRSPR